MTSIQLYVGFDPREAVAYHVFSQSVIENSSAPVAIHPLSLHMLKDYSETHKDGSNAFIYSRFLIPHLQSYNGWAIFCDGDMVCLGDISKLWDMRDETKAVMVVKHNYQSKQKRKYIGTSMETHNASYPRKNWSSVMLWNCSHPSNRILTPHYVMASTGDVLHRFKHLGDDEIGELLKEWNHLVTEQEDDAGAKLLHFTLGIPAIAHYATCDRADEWFAAHDSMNHLIT